MERFGSNEYRNKESKKISPMTLIIWTCLIIVCIISGILCFIGDNYYDKIMFVLSATTLITCVVASILPEDL